MRARAFLLAAMLAACAARAATCAGTVYLTFDTGHMEPAYGIAAILDKHQVKATFFLANEKTKPGDTALDPSWAPSTGSAWRMRATPSARTPGGTSISPATPGAARSATRPWAARRASSSTTQPCARS